MTARQWATDATLAVLATGADLALALSGHQWHGQPSPRPGVFAIVLLIVGGAALLARRRTRGQYSPWSWR